MTVSLFWRVQTADFDSWLNPDADALAQMMQSQGVLAFSTHRDTDDPNSAVVHLEFADRGALDAFEAWYTPMKEAWLKEFPGTEHTVAERWVCDDLPGYARSFG